MQVEKKYRHHTDLYDQCADYGRIYVQVAEDLFSRGLCLLSGTAMTETDLERIVDIILNF